MLTRIAGSLAVATAFLLTTTPALAGGISHDVVPFTSVAGVRFGWSPAQVRRKLGRPAKSTDAGGEPGEYIYNVGGDENLTYFFEADSPHDGMTSASVGIGFHTIRGIHSALYHGSTEASVRRAFGRYPHFRCHGSDYCTTTRGAAYFEARYGAEEMQFDFAGRKLIGFDLNKNLSR